MDGSPEAWAAFFARPVTAVARDLLGCTLSRGDAGGRIVETEAYERTDPASHSLRGPTPRNAAMFGPVGRLYVYRSYGMHWCLNVVCGTEPGGAVLIRALEPTSGLDAMRARRGLDAMRLLCGGPGRLCQALGVGATDDGQAVTAAPFGLRPATARVEVVVGPRIGITKAAERPWRFGVRGSPFLSRGFPREAPVSGAAAPP